LNDNNIKTIIDLRAEHEIEKSSYNNDFIKNFNYVKAPFDPWNQPEWFKKTQHFGTNTEIAYRFFVLACKNEVKKVFEAILNTDGAVAIHCLAGKDRTGFIIMLINMLIETPYKIMLADYLASELDAEEDKFKIYYDNILKEGGILKYLKSCGLNESKLNKIKHLDELFRGKRIEKWDERNKMYYDQDGYHAPIEFGVYHEPIVDRDLKELLEERYRLEERGLVQYLKTPVVDIRYKEEAEGKTEEELKKEGIMYYEYWIMNILTMLPHEVIDDEKSNYDSDRIYTGLVLCKNKLKEYEDRLEIFRVDEDFKRR